MTENRFRWGRPSMLLVMLVPWGQSAAAQIPIRQDTIPRTSPVVVTAALLGSAAGLAGGVAAGEWARKQWNFDRTGEDPGLASQVAGGLIGSVFGTTLGATGGGLLQQQRPVAFGQRMRDGVVGALLGLVVGYAVRRATDDTRAGVVAYSLTQGLYAGLSNGRW